MTCRIFAAGMSLGKTSTLDSIFRLYRWGQFLMTRRMALAVGMAPAVVRMMLTVIRTS
jgi:hypothetical protein